MQQTQAVCDERDYLQRRAMIGIYTGMQTDVTNIIAAALTKKIQSRAG